MRFPQIESEAFSSEKDLDDAVKRLWTLGEEINALKTKRANNSMAAARAEETATMAREKANEAKQVRVSMCTRLFLVRNCTPADLSHVLVLRF